MYIPNCENKRPLVVTNLYGTLHTRFVRMDYSVTLLFNRLNNLLSSEVSYFSSLKTFRRKLQ